MADKDFVVKNGLSVNGSILVVNAGTKSVGINTSSPDANLTISGTANVSGNLTVSGTMFGNLVGTANNANNLGGTVASSYALKTYANSAADQAYSNAQTYSSNADNISSGTLNTARLPATANVSTALNVGANVSVNTSAILIGNSTVRIIANSTAISGSANATLNLVSATTFTGTLNGTANDSNYLGGTIASSYATKTYADSSSNTAAATAYSNAQSYSANATNITSGTLNTARLPATANLGTALNVGSNVTINTSSFFVGNSTVNVTVSSTNITGGANATLNLVSATTFTGTLNGTANDSNYLGGTIASSYATKVYADSSSSTAAATAYSNARSYSANATNITSGTLNTARLPATANISTALNVGSNVTVNASSFFVGNSTVNVTISSTNIAGTPNAAFNAVTANTITGNGSSVTSVNAIAVGGNSAATLRSYSDTTAATAYSNGQTYADTKAATAYSNAQSYVTATVPTLTSNATTYVLGGGSVTTNTITVGTAVYFVSNGNVGFGTNTPGYKIDVAGAINATGDITSSSDRRLKINIEKIENALEKICRLNGVTFNKIGDDRRSTGLIAQDAMDVIPEAVAENTDGYLSVAYGNMVGLLVEAIKELKVEVDKLKHGN